MPWLLLIIYNGQPPLAIREQVKRSRFASAVCGASVKEYS
jgi:hypothetical protein